MKLKNPILLVLLLFLALVGLNFLFYVDKGSADETEETGDRSSYRSTPFGSQAFYTLLEESGYPVMRLQVPYTEMATREETVGALVLISLPEEHNPSSEEFDSLNSWVEKGGLLIIIDRLISVPVGDAKIQTGSVVLRTAARPLQPSIYTRDVDQIELSRLAKGVTIDSNSVTYHLGTEQAAVLADARIGKGRVVALGDPYPVANNGIAKADNVTLALNLFADRPPGKIAFDEYHHGYGSSTREGMMAYFRGTPVPWMMWQAGLVGAAIIYTYGRRFARPLPLRRERRTTNLEFVSSMANITRLARATDVAMQNIYSEFRKRLCRYSNLPVNANWEPLARVAAQRARLDENDLRQLLVRCEQISRGAAVADSEMLRLVARIREIESTLGF